MGSYRTAVAAPCVVAGRTGQYQFRLTVLVSLLLFKRQWAQRLLPILVQHLFKTISHCRTPALRLRSQFFSLDDANRRPLQSACSPSSPLLFLGDISLFVLSCYSVLPAGIQNAVGATTAHYFFRHLFQIIVFRSQPLSASRAVPSQQTNLT